MDDDIKSVVISKKPDGSWQAFHVPSGKMTHGETKEEAEEEMRKLIGLNADNQFDEPLTSDRFAGLAKEIALFLEGQVSEMLAMHSGYGRLEAFDNGIAHIRLGGGCQGCPSSTITLLMGVKQHLQEKFGEEMITDVLPV